MTEPTPESSSARKSQPLPAPGEHELEWPPPRSVRSLLIGGAGLAVAVVGALLAQPVVLQVEASAERARITQAALQGEIVAMTEGSEDDGYASVNRTEGGAAYEAHEAKRAQDRQEIDRLIAENAGVLGQLRDAGELDGVFGSSGLNSDLTDGIGGLIGARGTQIGSGGLGARGSGLGCNDSGCNSAQGLGGLGTRGRGLGSSGYGRSGGGFGGPSSSSTHIGGDPIILGALDRSLIDAVIKRHMNQVRYCYQRELTTNPSLAGKIVVKFVIAKDGTVSSAKTKATTMGSPAVEECLNGRFLRMQFPEPKGGGIVIVSYPFVFSPD